MNVIDKVLEMIKEYNSQENNRKITPKEDFGKHFLQDTVRYFSSYHNDLGEEVIIGFKQRGDYFSAPVLNGKLLNVDKAVDYFRKELSDIPLK